MRKSLWVKRRLSGTSKVDWSEHLRGLPQDSIDPIELVLSSQQDVLLLFITVPSLRGPLYWIGVCSSADWYHINSTKASNLSTGLNVMPLDLYVVPQLRQPSRLQFGPLWLQKVEFEEAYLLRMFLYTNCTCDVWWMGLVKSLLGFMFSIEPGLIAVT